MGSEQDLRRWDEVAQRYANVVEGSQNSFYRRLRPFLDEQVGPVRGQRILDLGCGHGWLAGILTSEGANLVGIDGSAALVGRARSAHPDVRFEVADLTEGLPAGLGTFDAVVCHMVLMDLPDLDRLLSAVRQVLTPPGVMVASLLHPSFFGQDVVTDDDGWHRKVTGYLQHEERWIDSFGGHVHYHRPLSWYVNAVCDAGMAITGLHEPPSLPQHTQAPALWDDYERWFSTVPTMLAFAARPTSALSGAGSGHALGHQA